MSIKRINIELQSLPETGQSFQYQIVRGNEPVTFTDSDGNSTDRIKKKFVKRGSMFLRRLGMSSKSGEIDNRFRSNVFQVNNTIVDSVYIPARGNRPELLVIIGSFTSITTQSQGNVPTRSYAILALEENGIEVYNANASNYGQIYNSVDYYEASDEIVIGGEFTEHNFPIQSLPQGRQADCLVFIDISSNYVVANSTKTKRFIDLGGIEGTNKDITQVTYTRGGNLLITGTFNKIVGISNSGLGMIGAAAGPVRPFMDNFRTNGRILRHAISNTGNIYITGNFSNINYTQKVALAKLNENGELVTGFNTNTTGFSGGSPTSIVSKSLNNMDDILFIGGTFNKFQGVDTGSIIKVDNVGNIDPSFTTYNTPISNINVRSLFLNIGPGINPEDNLFDGLMVGGKSSSDPDVNGYVLDLSGNIKYKLYVNSDVNSFFEAGNHIFFAGSFTLFDNTTQVLTNHEVEIGNNISQTITNLHNNLNTESLNGDSIYTSSNPIERHDYYYFTGDVLVQNIRQVPNYIKIWTEDIDSGGNPINVMSVLDVALTRSDFIFKSYPGDFEYTNFNLKTYKGNIDSIDSGETLVIKKQLLQGQGNTYLNLSSLINKGDISEVDLIRYIKSSTNTLFPTKQGKFGYITAVNYTGNNPLGTRSRKFLIVNGFRDTLEPITTVSPVLINGDYREVVRGEVMYIPINMSKVDACEISNLTSLYFGSLNGYNNNQRELDGYLNYLKIDTTDFDKLTTLTFYLNFTKMYEIKVRVRDGNCISGNTKVYFENRWGQVEKTTLTGKLKSSYKVDSKDFYTSIVDENGNLIGNTHQNKIFNRNSQMELEVNTGSVSSKLNDMYVDLVHSEKVWLEDPNGLVIPVIITDHNFREGYDDLRNIVNYNFKFKEASTHLKNIS